MTTFGELQRESGTPVGWIQPSPQAMTMQAKSTTETATRIASARIMAPFFDPLSFSPRPPRSIATPAQARAARMAAKATPIKTLITVDYLPHPVIDMRAGWW
jgi:hypothetical protein